jgi:TPR repeat protein
LIFGGSRGSIAPRGGRRGDDVKNGKWGRGAAWLGWSVVAAVVAGCGGQGAVPPQPLAAAPPPPPAPKDPMTLAREACASPAPDKVQKAARACVAKEVASCLMLCVCGPGEQLQSEACFEAGKMHHGAKQMEAAIAAFARACDLRVPEGCFNAGLVTAKGVDLPRKDYGRAAGFYTRACEAGVMAACTNLGVIYSDGRDGVPEDDPRAVQLFKRACDGNEPLGCGNLGNMYFRGEGVAKDQAKAYGFFDRACKGGSDRSCGMLGLAYVEGAAGYPRDPPRGIELLRRACDKDGGGDACAQLAELYQEGIGTTRDVPAAASLYKKACKAGHGKACVRLATSLPLGAVAEAPAWLEMGCGGGDRDSCLKLAEMLEKGGMVAPNPDKALELYEAACTEGAAQGCRQAAALLEKRGDADRARDLGARACRIAKDPSCAR